MTFLYHDNAIGCKNVQEMLLDTSLMTNSGKKKSKLDASAPLLYKGSDFDEVFDI